MVLTRRLGSGPNLALTRHLGSGRPHGPVSTVAKCRRSATRKAVGAVPCGVLARRLRHLVTEKSGTTGADGSVGGTQCGSFDWCGVPEFRDYGVPGLQSSRVPGSLVTGVLVPRPIFRPASWFRLNRCQMSEKCDPEGGGSGAMRRVGTKAPTFGHRKEWNHGRRLECRRWVAGWGHVEF